MSLFALCMRFFFAMDRIDLLCLCQFSVECNDIYDL